MKRRINEKMDGKNAKGSKRLEDKSGLRSSGRRSKIVIIESSARLNMRSVAGVIYNFIPIH